MSRQTLHLEFSLVRKLTDFRLCKEVLASHVAGPAGEQYREDAQCVVLTSLETQRESTVSAEVK